MNAARLELTGDATCGTPRPPAPADARLMRALPALASAAAGVALAAAIFAVLIPLCC